MTNEQVVHIGSVVPVLAHLTEYSQQIILDGFRMAYLHRYVDVKGVRWEIVDIYSDPKTPSKILARVQERPLEQEQAA